MRTSSVADIAPHVRRRGRTTLGYGHAYSNHAICWTRISGDTLVDFRTNGCGQGKDGCVRGARCVVVVKGTRRDASGQYVRSVHRARMRFNGDKCVPMESYMTHPQTHTGNGYVGYRYIHVRYTRHRDTHLFKPCELYRKHVT